MLTYVPPSDLPIVPSEQKEQPWLLMLLCAIWLFPGLLGHDPWKPAENQSVAIIQHMLNGGGWSLPALAGLPWLENAPLYYWGAALVGKALGCLGVPLHDAARLTAGLWMGLAMWGVGLAGRELHGRRQGRVAVVALIGSVGLLMWGHHAAPAMVGFAAFAWQLYALALARRRALQAGGLLGLAWLVLLLGATWGEVVLAVMGAVVLLFSPAWRKSSYLAALLAAFTIALPLGLLWPLSLYQHAPIAFSSWWQDQSLGLYGGIGAFNIFHQPGYLPSIVVWFAFPVLPLAAWALWINRTVLTESRWFLLLSQSLLVTLWLVMAGEPGEAQSLLLLVPLAILAAAGVDELRRGAASSLYWFGATTFGALALVFWGAWLVVLSGWPVNIAQELQQLSPSHVPALGLGALFALGLTLAWVRVLLGKRPLGRRAVTAWACGVTLVWGVLVGLWQPWLDASKTYRLVGEEVQKAARPYSGCIAAPRIGPAQLGGIAYFSGRTLLGSDNAGECALLLAQSAMPPLGGKRILLWQGGRPGEHNERFYLYRTK